MKFYTKAQEAKLRANAKVTEGAGRSNLRPVIKLFNPCGAATWLISELHEDGLAFGLCDLGFGQPELGFVDLTELAEIRLPFGLGIERDRHFKANKNLVAYANEARSAGRIAA